MQAGQVLARVQAASTALLVLSEAMVSVCVGMPGYTQGCKSATATWIMRGSVCTSCRPLHGGRIM